MATSNQGNETHTSTASNSNGVQKALEQQKAAKRRKRKFIIFGVEIVLLAVMLGVLFLVYSRGGEGPGIAPLPTEPEQLGIATEVQQEMQEPESVMKGYWNIALFGIDANNDAEMIKGGHSDSTMIASINLDTGEIRIVSVYRDTYLNTNPGVEKTSENDPYRKSNAAYASGGAERAVRMLNSNLDMNITDYVAIGYKGLIDIVDGLGGVYLDVDEGEIKHIDNYQISILRSLGKDPDKEGAYVPVTSTGYQKLNGLQATAYCRIRYDRKGYDLGRAASQREVIMAIEERAKQADLDTLTKVFEAAMKNVVTSLTVAELTPYLAQIADYKIVGEDGFPQTDKLGYAGMDKQKGDCVIPLDLESNVVWLHEFLFGDKNYTVSSTVKEYSAQIEKDTAGRLK